MEVTKESLLKKRMDYQQEACQSLFSRVHFEDYNPHLRVNVDCYYLKLDDSGKPRVRDLAQYIGSMLTQYVHTLSKIYDSLSDPVAAHQLSIDAMRFLVAKNKKGELGEFILWMLLEGVAGVPKVLTKHPHKTNTNMQNFGSDGVHAGYDTNGNLIIYWGESKLYSDVKAAINKAVNSFNDHLTIKSGKVALDQDIYLIDNYSCDDVYDEKLQKLLKAFVRPGSITRGNTIYQLAAFVGYNSKILSDIESMHFSKVQNYLEIEYCKQSKEICDIIKGLFDGNSDIQNLRVMWFVLPFKSVDDFVKTFLSIVRGEDI